MKKQTTGDPRIAQDIALMRPVRASRLGSPGHPSEICIVGVGTTGARLLDTLMHEDAKRGTTFLRAAVMGGPTPAGVTGNTWELLPNEPLVESFADAVLVLIVCCAHEAPALRASAVVANAARQAHAMIIGLLVPAPALPVHRSMVKQAFAGSADALVALPPAPQPALLQGLIDVFWRLAKVDPPHRASRNGQTGGDLLDVCTVFARSAHLSITSASAMGPKRARQAAARAIADLGMASLADTTGVLVLIAGPPSMRLGEIHDVTVVIRDSIANRAEMVLGLFYSAQYGDTLRVAVLAGFET
ncbi:hypothetical protein [Cupriavidus pauculus]|uniref:hypothetical protein n=1 Tax=Cupriavidus pauculus TaxID=82633 RepID=UPI001D0C0751|nr:hypothetical protein [Cupriavidus pauculus]